MALTVTVAGADSDSYCTLEEITANLTGKALASWNAISTEAEQEAYARRVTSIIDLQLYRGTVFDEDQALAFPRSGHYATDTLTGEAVPYIPSAIKKAVYAQLNAMLTGFGEGFADQIMEYRAKGVTGLSMGLGSSMQFTKKAPGPRDFLCAEARVLLSQYFAHPTIRLERA